MLVALTLFTACPPGPDPDYLSLSPEGSITLNNGRAQLHVSTNVSWSVTQFPSWLTVSSTNGRGDQMLLLTEAEPNPYTTPRQGTLTVKSNIDATLEANIIVIQPATTATPSLKLLHGGSEYSNYPLTLGSEGGTEQFTVEANGEWSVTQTSGTDSWLTVEATKTSGTNNGTIRLTAAKNTSTSERESTVTVMYGGKPMATIAVKQLGVTEPDVLTVDSKTETTVTFSSATAADMTFSVQSNIAWTATSNDNWCTVSPKSGNGNATVSVHVAENTGNSERKTTIKVVGGGITCTVNVKQPAPEQPVLLVNGGTTASIPVDTPQSTERSVSITANVAWTAKSDLAWCQVSPASGTNNGTLKLQLSPNDNAISRTATVTISGGGMSRLVSVTQAGVTISAEPNTVELKHDGTGTNNVVTVTTNAADFTANSDKSWCGYKKNGNKLTITADANSNTSERDATITLQAGNVKAYIKVKQLGKPYLTVNKTLVEFGIDGGNQTVDVSSNVSWTVSENASWITLDRNSGTGNGSVTITVTANTTGSSRERDITFTGGETPVIVTVKQTTNVKPGENDNPLPDYSRKSK